MGILILLIQHVLFIQVYYFVCLFNVSVLVEDYDIQQLRVSLSCVRVCAQRLGIVPIEAQVNVVPTMT